MTTTSKRTHLPREGTPKSVSTPVEIEAGKPAAAKPRPIDAMMSAFRTEHAARQHATEPERVIERIVDATGPTSLRNAIESAPER